jgi:hypothetical protein
VNLGPRLPVRSGHGMDQMKNRGVKMKNSRTLSAMVAIVAVACATWMSMALSHHAVSYDANGLPTVDVYQLTMSVKGLHAQQFDAI